MHQPELPIAPSTSPEALDFAIVIALDEEFSVFQNNLPHPCFHLVPAPSQQNQRLYRLTCSHGGSTQLTGLVLVIGDQGERAARESTARFLEHHHPRHLFSIGRTGSLNGDIKIGDVLFVKNIFPYLENSKAVAGRLRTDAPTQAILNNLATDLYNHFAPKTPSREYVESMSNFQLPPAAADCLRRKKQYHKLVSTTPNFHTGSLASGSMVVADNSIKESIKDARRKIAAVEMECYGIMQAIDDHLSRQPASPLREMRVGIIRGMSDHADHDKSQLQKDFGDTLERHATCVAALTLVEYLENLLHKKSVPHEPLDALHRELRQLCVNNYVNPRYTKYASVSSSPIFPSALLAAVLGKGPLEPTSPGLSLIAWLQQQTSNTQVLRVTGPQGCGQSMLAATLYFELLNQFHAGVHADVPVLIDLNAIAYPFLSLPAGAAATAVQRHILRRLYPLLHLQAAGFKCILIINNDNNLDPLLKIAASEALALASKSLACVVSIGHTAISASASQPGMAIATQQLSQVDCRHVSLTKLIAEYQIVLGHASTHGSLADSVAQALRRIGSAHASLTEIRLLINAAHSNRTGDALYLSEALSEYCQEHIQPLDPTQVATAIQHSVQTGFASSERRSPTGVDLQWWAPIAPFVDFLIAKQVYDVVLSYDGRAKSDNQQWIRMILPHSSTRFLRELLLLNPSEQIHLVKNAKRIVGASIKNGRAEDITLLIYMLGRVTNDQAVQMARGILEEIHKNCSPTFTALDALAIDESDTHRPLRLLRRSILISQASLGDGVAARRYIQLLLTNKTENDLNRGFHLEYYGDQPYVANSPMVNRDSMGEWSLTRQRLIDKITGRHAVLPHIEVATLASFAYVRAHADALDSPARRECIDVLKPLQLGNKLLYPDLQEFVNSTVRLLEGSDPPGQIATAFQYLKIKDQIRAGWAEHGIQSHEVVASHILGCLIIAMIFVDDDLFVGHEAVDKDMLIKMLLIHDLGEATEGDIPTNRKSPADTQQEAESVRRLSYAGLLPGIASLTHLPELWDAFEHPNTATARLARDIDRLEPLFEMARQGHATAGSHMLKAQIAATVATPFGKDLLRRLESHIEREGASAVSHSPPAVNHRSR